VRTERYEPDPFGIKMIFPGAAGAAGRAQQNRPAKSAKAELAVFPTEDEETGRTLEPGE
jgi:hypothetical protein